MFCVKKTVPILFFWCRTVLVLMLYCCILLTSDVSNHRFKIDTTASLIQMSSLVAGYGLVHLRGLQWEAKVCNWDSRELILGQLGFNWYMALVLLFSQSVIVVQCCLIDYIFTVVNTGQYYTSFL